MRFKDEYKNEMNCITHNANLDEAILTSDTSPVKAPKRRIYVKKYSAIALAALSLVVIANFSNIRSFGDNIIGKYRLYTTDSRNDMDDLNPVDFDIERFSSLSNVTKDDTDGISYFTNGLDAATLSEYAGIELPKNSEVLFYDISVDVSETYKNGHLTMFLSDGKTIDTHMNGQFLINGCDSSQFLGYGFNTGKIVDEYTCRNGSKAYFIKENEQSYDKDRLAVVFCADDIQYQLFIDDTEEYIQFAKTVADTMVK